MVYSTCTFAPEENEGTILAFLKSHDDFYLEERECPKGLMAAVPQWAFFGADKEDDSERDLAGENGIEKYHLERAFRIMPLANTRSMKQDFTISRSQVPCP